MKSLSHVNHKHVPCCVDRTSGTAQGKRLVCLRIVEVVGLFCSCLKVGSECICVFLLWRAPVHQTVNIAWLLIQTPYTLSRQCTHKSWNRIWAGALKRSGVWRKTLSTTFKALKHRYHSKLFTMMVNGTRCQEFGPKTESIHSTGIHTGHCNASKPI